jgi:hypothetical protein
LRSKRSGLKHTYLRKPWCFAANIFNIAEVFNKVCSGISIRHLHDVTCGINTMHSSFYTTLMAVTLHIAFNYFFNAVGPGGGFSEFTRKFNSSSPHSSSSARSVVLNIPQAVQFLRLEPELLQRGRLLVAKAMPRDETNRDSRPASPAPTPHTVQYPHILAGRPINWNETPRLAADSLRLLQGAPHRTPEERRALDIDAGRLRRRLLASPMFTGAPRRSSGSADVDPTEDSDLEVREIENSDLDVLGEYTVDMHVRPRGDYTSDADIPYDNPAQPAIIHSGEGSIYQEDKEVWLQTCRAILPKRVRFAPGDADIDAFESVGSGDDEDNSPEHQRYIRAARSARERQRIEVNQLAELDRNWIVSRFPQESKAGHAIT